MWADSDSRSIGWRPTSKGSLPDRLHGVGVEQRAGFASDAAELGDRLHRADDVVGGHDRDQRGCRAATRAASVVGLDQAVAVDRQQRHRDAARLRGARHGLQDRRVLEGAASMTCDAARRVGRRAPRIARLSASVPLPVKTISGGRAPSSAATWARAGLDGVARLAARPVQARRVAERCRSRKGCIAARTRGSSGVVAAWSK